MLSWLYRLLQSTVIKDCILPLFFSKRRIQDASENSIRHLPMTELSGDCARHKNKNGRIWFHAASVGELESLWPLVISAAEKNKEIILTILSESARGTLEHLKKLLLERGTPVVFAGYSPWEGEWGEALKKLKPSLFVTAKYEAWPDLWMSLQEADIPLAIVSARCRKSIRIARWICQVAIGKLPQLLFFPCVESDVSDLRKLFPQSEIQTVGEPRWDRVVSRSRQGNSRAKELIQVYQRLKRPWGIIGSAWPEDLNFLDSVLKNVPGTLWIVPHKVDSDSVRKMEKFLLTKGLRPVKTSSSLVSAEEMNHLQPPCLLVDEMGFLSELYSVADWAFVGGGFGVGIHSTIEPAIHGIPIAVGPNGTRKFSEVQELQKSGQLTIVKRPEEIQRWLGALESQYFHEKQNWAQEAESRLGATQKIMEAIEKLG